MIEFRPAQIGDEKNGWPEANKLLNSPHAPTSESGCLAHAVSTQNTINGTAVGAQQINLVAQEYTANHSRIIAGAAIGEMEVSNEAAPWLWRWSGVPQKSDLELIRYRPPEYPPSLELGGISVHRDFLGKGIGGAISWVRSRVASHFAHAFFPDSDIEPNILVDCLPKCNRSNKVNPFWMDALVPQLKESRVWSKVVDFCIEKAKAFGIDQKDAVKDENGEDQSRMHWFLSSKNSGSIDYESEDASIWVSWFIGNKMSDSDRNALITNHFPKVIRLGNLGADGVMESIGSIDPATVPAMKNVRRNHPSLKEFAYFPTNVGINATAKAGTAPTGQGPVELTYSMVPQADYRKTIFFTEPENGDLASLANFRAYFSNASLSEAGLTVPIHMRELVNLPNGSEVKYYQF